MSKMKGLSEPDPSMARHSGCGHCGAQSAPDAKPAPKGGEAATPGELAVERAVLQALFPQDALRRRFLTAVGAGTALSAISTLFPLGAAKEAFAQSARSIEKPKLNVGFIPITCATPIIMAHPMGFYSRHGLDVDVVKTAGWAVIRDKTLNKEYDAAHMLSPMPLAITLGAGAQPVPYTMPAVENINGQAITLAMKHKDKRDPKSWKGFKFAVPFDYSMHNYLLRYYVAEHGLDPDRDIQIRAVPPPEMVANMRADNIDGFLAPDPVNQRAVYDGVGFIHVLSKEIWEGHPCCAFAASREFVTQLPNTYHALLKAIIDATAFARKSENRKQIAEAIAPANYLNQPVTVVEQVLTGTFADGLGNIRKVPDRIDFDPFPWHSFAVWILTQMKRWGQIKGDVNYEKVAREVFLATDAAKLMKEVGLAPPPTTSKKFTVMKKEFDPAKPDAYLASFAIKRTAEGRSMTTFTSWRAPALSLLLLLLFVGVWHAATLPTTGPQTVGAEYAKLVGAAASTGQKSAFPSPADFAAKIWTHLKQPFYDNGPNDKGIGIQLAYSLARVLAGYLLAALVAIPIGFLIGMSPLVYRALDPFIQVLKPISPLAWMPLALFTLKDSGVSAIFVIFICSLWPMLINTAFGVAAVRREWLNVARTLEVGPIRRAFRVILPAAAPTIMTGMRISIGIAWLVIVAAEMLVGGTGIGYFVWNEWNNLSITNILTAILAIGLIGMLLDQILARLTRLVTFPE